MVQRIIREERFKSFVMTFVYVFALFCGVIAAANPPNSIEWALRGGNIGPYLPYLWAGLLILCGVFGLAGIGGAALWAERVALRSGFTGLAFYAAIVLSLHGQGSGNRLPQFFALAIATAAILLRWPDVRRGNYSCRAIRRGGDRGAA